MVQHFNERMTCLCGQLVAIFEQKPNGDEVAVWLCGRRVRLPVGGKLQEESRCGRRPSGYDWPSS